MCGSCFGVNKEKETEAVGVDEFCPRIMTHREIVDRLNALRDSLRLGSGEAMFLFKKLEESDSLKLGYLLHLCDATERDLAVLVGKLTEEIS